MGSDYKIFLETISKQITFHLLKIYNDIFRKAKQKIILNLDWKQELQLEGTNNFETNVPLLLLTMSDKGKTPSGTTAPVSKDSSADSKKSDKDKDNKDQKKDDKGGDKKKGEDDDGRIHYV